MTASPTRADPRLHVMMFMQYAVSGIWVPIAARFLSADPAVGGLGFSDKQIGIILATSGAMGAFVSPFLAGQIADRYFATQRFLSALLIVGGVVKLVTAYQTSYAAWVALSVVYALVFVPTGALTNSLALANLSNPRRQFPIVRVWGTIAWIAVAWFFPMLWLQTNLKFQWLPPFFKGDLLPNAPARMLDSVKLAGVMSIGYGLFCLALPHTPPRRDAVQKLAFLKVLALLRNRSYAVLMLAALLISTVHTIYFLQTSKFLSALGLGDAYIMPAMSIGQIAEIAVMAAVGPMLIRTNFRVVIILGAFCYVLRYAIFGTVGLPLGVIVASQFLHGFCFACFLVGCFIYIDRVAPADARHSTQTVFTLIISGAGALLSGWLNGYLARLFTVGGRIDYAGFWYACAGIALAAMLLLIAGFRDESSDQSPAGI